MVCSALNRDDTYIPQASSFGRLRRIIAYVIRFTKKCRGDKIDGHLKLHEIRDATMCIERYIQQQYFNEEMQALKNGRNVSSSSKIKALCVFLDENNLIRVGERLKNSALQYDMKHQILLPKCEITNGLDFIGLDFIVDHV